MRSLVPVALAATLAATLGAQIPIVCPNGLAATEGNSNNAFPWNRGSATAHVQFIYDSSNFTLQQIPGPVAITRMRFRADAANTTWSGGTYSRIQIDMSTCPVDYLAASTLFASNHGANRTTVLNGPLTILGGTVGSTGPGPWHIDIPLATPFVYDPSSGGDLTVDIMLDGATWGGGSLVQADHHTGGALGTRVFDVTSNVPNSSSGTLGTDYVAVCEFTCVPGSGFASTAPYGEGCNKGAVSFYESFPVSTFDLGSATGTNVLQMIPTGGGYVVVPGAPNWFTPTSSNLALGDDAISAPQALPFTFNYPGGSTNSVVIESNGNVWLTAPSHTSFICSTSSGSLLTRGGVISAFYDDLDPSATGGGSVTFDVDPSGQAVYCTWTGVPIWLATPPSPRPTNTFQVAILNGGIVELRYQQMDSTGSWTSTLTGFSPGQNNRDPGPRDLSASMPFTTMPDSTPLALLPVGRPNLGNATFGLRISDIPSTSVVGALLLGFTQLNPGVPLAAVGMPGCSQYTSVGSLIVTPFAASPTTVTLPIPNLPGLVGLQFFGQAAAFDATANSLGLLASNGMAMRIDQN